MTHLFDSYFCRFGFGEQRIQSRPHPDLELVVVIPCFNEPELTDSLESLWACARPACAVEVIVVINSGVDSPMEISAQNERTLRAARAWAHDRVDPKLTFYFLHCPDLPKKQAGVGLARKIGMDEAARRLDSLGKARPGVIACFDADCRCAPDYLVALAQHFRRHPSSPGCSIYFEHPLAGPFDSRIYEAIARYELHLRYFVQALRHAGFPYAHHTVGSSMAVRADVYLRQGGMNRRQAGEDFYFLQKIIPLGGYTDLVDTCVSPSPRLSDRVPFGTGRAVRQFIESGALPTEPLQGFLDLKELFASLNIIHGMEKFTNSAFATRFSPALSQFLQAASFDLVLVELRTNTASLAAFRKRFYTWFNSFAVVKFLHSARARFYRPVDLMDQASTLLSLIEPTTKSVAVPTVLELLTDYRRLDRLRPFRST